MKSIAFLTALLSAFSVSANATSWMQYDQSNSPLPSNSVTATLNDGEVTWVGTNDGLAMFDGLNWTIYKSETSQLPDDHVYNIYKDNQENTWVSTNMGLLKISMSGWEVVNMANSEIPTTQIRSILSAQQNNLWIGTWGSGLLKYDGATWTVYNDQNSQLSSNGIFDVELDETGNVWVGTYNGGVSKFDGQNWTTYSTSNSELPHDNVRDITIDENGIVWFGTDDGIARKTAGNHWDVFTYLELGHSVHAVYQGIKVASGHIYFATDGGLVEFDGSTIEIFTAQNSDLPSNNLRSISEDSNQNLWLGTGNNGVAIFSEQDLLSVSNENKPDFFIPFPSPTSGSLTLDLQENLGQEFEVLVHNSIGQMVYRTGINQYSSGNYDLDLSDLPDGALSITIVSDRFSDTKRVLKL